MNLFEKTENMYVEGLKVGMKVDWYYKLVGLTQRTKRDGNPYLAVELMDKTGRIPGKIWDNAQSYLKFLKEGNVYRVAGYVNEFMNKKEIKVDGIRALSDRDTNYSESDFVEQAGFDTDTLFKQMMADLGQDIKSTYLLRLLELFQADYGDKFKTHYGAQKIHHAYLGGLLKHTASMVRLARFIADHYDLDKEILLVGVLFHDIGKMFEFEIEPAVNLTMEGGLIGHLLIGTRIFQDLKNRIPDFPDDVAIHIQHLVISHHGEKEFGSPEVPKTREAFALNLIDLIDSRMNIVEEAIDGAENNDLFSEYLHPLGRRVYLGNGKK